MVAFGLEKLARGPYEVPNLADIKDRIWVAHCLRFRWPSSFPMGVLDSNSRESSTLSPTWAVAYNRHRAMYGR